MNKAIVIFLSFISINLCSAKDNNAYELSNPKYKISIDNNFKTSLFIKDKLWKKLAASEPLCFLRNDKGKELKNFTIKKVNVKNDYRSDYGNCKYLEITAKSIEENIEIDCKIFLPLKYDNSIIINTSINNLSGEVLKLSGYTISNFILNARDFGADSAYKFWSFQGGSYEQRFDWIFPLTKNYSRKNYQGMNAADYGGGMPIIDFWTKEHGIAFASLSDTPELISLPVKVNDEKRVEINITKEQNIIIKPGQKLNFIPFAIIFHNGDYYNALSTYSDLMQSQGLQFTSAPKDAYQTEWCAWGYERNFNKEQILKSLEEVKKLGLKWVTIDDGWQYADGDWEIDKSKFPGGDEEFKTFIDSIHSKGLKVRIWWVPFEAQDSAYNVKHFPHRMNEYGMKTQSSLALNHPNWFILDKEGNRIQVSWWNSFYLCPAVPGVIEYYKHFVEKAINIWGIDGFKIDGQNLNAVPQCYNSVHNHLSPEIAPKSVPDFFKAIYKTAVKLKPDFLIQICPCGTNFSLYNLPYVNQTVASDPIGAWQVRLKGKTFKALLGNKIAYSGDHVELTNRIWDESIQKENIIGKEDFVSTIAVGGVLSTKFTMPGLKQPDNTLILTPSKEKKWEKWISFYNEENLKNAKYI